MQIAASRSDLRLILNFQFTIFIFQLAIPTRLKAPSPGTSSPRGSASHTARAGPARRGRRPEAGTAAKSIPDCATPAAAYAEHAQRFDSFCSEWWISWRSPIVASADSNAVGSALRTVFARNVKRSAVRTLRGVGIQLLIEK